MAAVDVDGDGCHQERGLRRKTSDSALSANDILPLPWSPSCLSLRRMSTTCSSDDDENQSRQDSTATNSSCVQFDPRITVREVYEDQDVNEELRGFGSSSALSSHQEDEDDNSANSNWFTEDELQSFRTNAIDLSISSSMEACKNYSVPAVSHAYTAAYQAGIKMPVVSAPHPPPGRSLFTDPALRITDEVVVHDGSNAFFELQRDEVRNILIVDSSIVGLKLLHRRMLAMFPYAKIGLTTSAEDAMKRIDFVSSTTTGSRMYDLLVVEERLEPREQHVAVHHGFCFNPQDDGSCPIGSQFLRYVEDVEEEVEARKVHDESDADGDGDGDDNEDDYFEDNDSQTRRSRSIITPVFLFSTTTTTKAVVLSVTVATKLENRSLS
jgi:hypothetical protein